MYKRTLCALAMIVASAAAAQNAPMPDAADPKARVQPVEYRSTFADYRPHKDAELAPWRAVNDEVGRIGGHLGIMRAQREPTKAAPKTSPHGMHHK